MFRGGVGEFTGFVVCVLCQKRLRLSCKVDECKPLGGGGGGGGQSHVAAAPSAPGPGTGSERGPEDREAWE